LKACVPLPPQSGCQLSRANGYGSLKGIVKDLRFYAESSLGECSGVELPVRFPGKPNGMTRLLFIYPFFFFVSSMFIAGFFLIFK
jgi:hypothetical protein